MKSYYQGRVYAFFSVLFLLQFVMVPFLGDMNHAGKLFLFIFFTLIYALFLNRSSTSLHVSSVANLLALLCVVFFAFSFQSFYPSWTFIQVLIFSVFLIYLYAVTHKFNEKLDKFDSFIDVLLLFSVFSAVLGLYEYFHFVFMGPSSTMLIPYLLPPDHSTRVVGVYGQPNLYAVILSVSILAFYYKYIHLPSEFTKRDVSIARFIPFSLVCTVFFMTQSRAGFLSLSLIVGFLSWLVASGRYLRDDRNRKNEFFTLTFWLLFCFLLVKGLALFQFSEIRALGETGVSTEARFIFWTSAVLIFLDHPWFGIGLDNYQFLMNTYGPKSHALLGFVQYESMGNTSWAHNELLQLICEGGVVALLILIFLLGLYYFKFWHNFVVKNTYFSPLFLYSHLFLLPFIFQSMFSWPFRSPPLLILFFTFLGGLLAQYPLRTLMLSKGQRSVICLLLVFGLMITSGLFYQEVKIGSFLHSLKTSDHVEETFAQFVKLAENPYSEHRVLSRALNDYAHVALKWEDGSFAEKIVPYYERLCGLEGIRWHWFELAHLYLKLGREDDAKTAIQHAIDLMPLEQKFWDFLHHLSVIKASRATGRPVKSFYPQEVNFDLKVLGQMNE